MPELIEQLDFHDQEEPVFNSDTGIYENDEITGEYPIAIDAIMLDLNLMYSNPDSDNYSGEVKMMVLLSEESPNDYTETKLKFRYSSDPRVQRHSDLLNTDEQQLFQITLKNGELNGDRVLELHINVVNPNIKDFNCSNTSFYYEYN
ncbi:MAG: hypothetical protein Q9M91_04485 [Candidatus Dojkabacteria bacterium]|nr:hypothetical protein [Candidatus Dojkabacteria bacterium]